MTPQQYERLTELFHAALEIAPTERQIFLDHISESDVELRRELEALLAAEATALSGKPPNDIAAGYLARMGDCPATLPILTPNTRLAHYQIHSLLGKGGMGEVYLAVDIRLHRKVALKVLPIDAANQDRMRRFEQEARAAAALNHPNIAHIYEIGESDGTYFIAMELVDGVTLRAKIDSERTELRKLLKYLQQVADALGKAHESGIVHRDLKPDNIMITRDDYIKVLDFGLAKLVEPPRQLGPGSASSEVDTATMVQHSLAGMVLGTAGYMSPEQAQGKVEQIDHRSDIFSFGCVLFETATGQKPFAHESVIKCLHKVVYEPAPSISDFNPSAPTDLQKVIRRCLAKDPAERYQTIKDVALELKELRQGMAEAAEMATVASSASTQKAGRPVEGQSTIPTSSAQYIVTEIKRHKKGVAVIFAALVVAFGYGLYRFVNHKGAANSPIKMKRLTAIGKVFAASISPDGKQVVYGVEDAGQQSIWVRQVAAPGNVQIVPPSDASYANFSFTRDGNYFYFNKREKGGRSSLYQIPSLGGMARKIMENVTSRAALSLDGNRIAFVRGDPFDKENSLVVANNDGGDEQVLAMRKGPDNFAGGIAWTPDGKSITCVAGEHARKLIEVPLGGGAEKLLNTPTWFAIMTIEWRPDGSGLIVITKEQSVSSPSQVWHLSYPSGEARKITDDFSNYVNLSLTEDASSLVVIKRETTSHVWLAPAGDASRAKQLTFGSGREDGYPALDWTPDGRIIYDSTASGSRHTWIMNADGSDQKQLTEGAYDDQGAHVSPDGRHVVFASNRTGTYHIYRMEIDGNNLKQLTNGGGESAPFFSPDGRWVICSSSTYVSWKVPVDGGALAQLTNSWAADMSPDSKLVAYVRPAAAGSLLWNIIIMPFAGGASLEVFDVISDSRPNLRWTRDGGAIIYNLTHGGLLSGVTNLWIQRLDGSAPKQLTNFTTSPFFGFDWSRDGQWLACGRRTTSSDVVLISNFQ